MPSSGAGGRPLARGACASSALRCAAGGAGARAVSVYADRLALYRSSSCKATMRLQSGEKFPSAGGSAGPGSQTATQRRCESKRGREGGRAREPCAATGGFGSGRGVRALREGARESERPPGPALGARRRPGRIGDAREISPLRKFAVEKFLDKNQTAREICYFYHRNCLMNRRRVCSSRSPRPAARPPGTCVGCRPVREGGERGGSR